MGKGGDGRTTHRASRKEHKSSSSSSKTKNSSSKNAVWATSFDPETFPKEDIPTKAQIKAIIPAGCFDRSALHSFSFVFRDSVWAFAVAFLASISLSTDIPTTILDGLLFFTGWSVYAFCMGTVLTGHWVLGHECGHGSFSDSELLNDTVGFIIHQLLLVPYFSWKYSHAKHHRRTNHIVDGESHVPGTRADQGLSPENDRLGAYAALHEIMGDGAFAGFQVFTHLVIGWPLYLMGVASTAKVGYDGLPLGDDIIDHFRPSSRMFPPKMRSRVLASTIGIVAMLSALAYASSIYGVLPVVLYYFGPYTVVNAWLVLYTWLQHTDPSVPQYGDDEWTWVLGALTTIDRPYGVFDYFHHKIGSTHVVHHLFHEMPFYRADEATVAVKEFLGPLYNYDPTNPFVAMWRIAKRCHYVEDVNGIQYFKSLEDIPLTTSKKSAGAKKRN